MVQNLLQRGPSSEHDATSLAKFTYDNGDDWEIYGLFVPHIEPGLSKTALNVERDMWSTWTSTMLLSAHPLDETCGSDMSNNAQLTTGYDCTPSLLPSCVAVVGHEPSMAQQYPTLDPEYRPMMNAGKAAMAI